MTELAIGLDAMDDQSSSYDRLMLKSRRLRGVLGDEDKLITELSGRGYRRAGVGSLGDASGDAGNGDGWRGEGGDEDDCEAGQTGGRVG